MEIIANKVSRPSLWGLLLEGFTVKIHVTIHVVPGVVHATNVVFAPAADSFTAPVAVGTVMGTISVEPPAWVGDIILSGNDAALFAVNALRQLVTAAELVDDRDYDLDIAAEP